MDLKHAAMYVALEDGEWQTVLTIMSQHFCMPSVCEIKEIMNRPTPGMLAAIVGTRDLWLVWTESNGFEASRRKEPIRSIDEGFEQFVKVFTREKTNS